MARTLSCGPVPSGAWVRPIGSISCGCRRARVTSRPLTYPEWIYFPTRSRPPTWSTDFVAVVADRRAEIDSRATSGVRSDQVLGELRPGLELLGYRVEMSKRRTDTVRRPVLFGDQGAEVVTYEVDAVHDELGILVEIEAGRRAMGNAVYRDLVHASLIVEARYLALGVMSEYRYTGGTARSYRDARRPAASDLRKRPARAPLRRRAPLRLLTDAPGSASKPRWVRARQTRWSRGSHDVATGAAEATPQSRVRSRVQARPRGASWPPRAMLPADYALVSGVDERPGCAA
jgi:hypothetical protein